MNMGLEKLNERKKALGIKTEELSKLSGVPMGTLNKILSGQSKKPTLESVMAIAHALGCSVDELSDGYAKTRPDALTSTEADLITRFRLLQPDDQAAILRIVRAASQAQYQTSDSQHGQEIADWIEAQAHFQSSSREAEEG